MEINLKLNSFLKECLNTAMDGESFNSERDFAVLGLDSISVFDFTSQLKEAIPEVPLTIFLECKNLNELQTYLQMNHEKELNHFFKSN